MLMLKSSDELNENASEYSVIMLWRINIYWSTEGNHEIFLS